MLDEQKLAVIRSLVRLAAQLQSLEARLHGNEWPREKKAGIKEKMKKKLPPVPLTLINRLQVCTLVVPEDSPGAGGHNGVELVAVDDDAVVGCQRVVNGGAHVIGYHPVNVGFFEWC